MQKQAEYKIEGRPSTIYRVVKNKENPYVMIDRRPIDNSRISFKAKGILTYLMSRPDGWEVSVADLINHATDGEDSVRSGMKELREAGHFKYSQSRVHGRITGWLIEVFEVPFSPDRAFPDVVLPDLVLPDLEKPTQVLSTLSNNESIIEEEEGATQNIFTLYEQEIGVITPFISDALEDWEISVGPLWISDAFKLAVKNNARNWAYCEAILKRWKAQGNQNDNKKAAKTSSASVPKGVKAVEEWLQDSENNGE